MAPTAVDITSEVIELREAMRNNDMNIHQLAERSGVCVDTIRKALDPNGEFGINEISAERIASALGTRSGKIRWLRGISSAGRTPGTGVAIQKRSKPRGNSTVCPTCPYTLPATNVCDNCN